jgi:hypothetical protein
MATKSIEFAGDISIDKVSIQSVDGTEFSLINQIVAIQIYEDLYSPFMTGSIIIKDSMDLINTVPLIGQELLNIDISTPSLKEKGGRINSQFFMYRIKNREYLGDKTVTYEMDFISKEAIVDSNTKLSRRYKGKISDIVASIVSDQEVQFDNSKRVIIEETYNDTIYISNYWSPIKNMNYLAEQAINKEKSPSYVFFENRDGFNFVTLNSLVTSPIVVQEFNYNSFSRQITKTNALRAVEMDFKRIHTISVRDGVNTLNRIHDGFMGCLLMTTDITTKTYNEKYYNALMGFSGAKHLNQYPLVSYKFPISPGAKIIVEPKAAQTFIGYQDATNTDILQQRLYEMHEKNDFILNIVVAGRLDYTVGQLVTIDTVKVRPIKKSESNDEIQDKIYSGKYLITAINHYITRKSHECNIEIAKDSYIKDFSQDSGVK